jgi:drug/metabolite transporter (DMT)-like permease
MAMWQYPMNKKQRLSIAQLLLSRIFSSVNKPALKLLITLGGPLGLQYPNSISFCNVLFVGNICASFIPLLMGGKKIIKELLSAPKIAYLFLFLGIVNAAIYPSLIYFSLLLGNVINIVLILRFRAISYAIFSYLITGETFKKGDITGYVIISFGLLVLILSNGLASFGLGELLAFIASIVNGLGSINDKKSISYFSIPTFLFTTEFFAATIFFVIVITAFNFYHFAQAFHGELWVIMFLYGGIGVMTSLFLWLKGLRNAPAVAVANISLLSPIFTLIATYLILGELPSIKQIIALIIITSGLVISRVIDKKQACPEEPVSS